jgi:hypothetical protein
MHEFHETIYFRRRFDEKQEPEEALTNYSLLRFTSRDAAQYNCRSPGGKNKLETVTEVRPFPPKLRTGVGEGRGGGSTY